MPSFDPFPLSSYHIIETIRTSLRGYGGSYEFTNSLYNGEATERADAVRY
jgi:hypothetical protein